MKPYPNMLILFMLECLEEKLRFYHKYFLVNSIQLVSIKDLTIAGHPKGRECPKSCPLEKIGIVG